MRPKIAYIKVGMIRWFENCVGDVIDHTRINLQPGVAAFASFSRAPMETVQETNSHDVESGSKEEKPEVPLEASDSAECGALTRVKQVTFRRQHNPKELPPITSVEHCLKAMKNGADFVKLRGRRQYRRSYALTEAADYITWLPTRKKREASRIAVRTIREVRIGQCTETFAKHKRNFEASRSFSIIHGADFGCLDLVAESPQTADTWVTGLKCLMDENFAEKTAGSRSHDHWVRKHFQQADKSGRGSVNEVEFLTMANALNVGLSPTKLKAKFKEYDVDSSGRLGYDEFVRLYQELSTRPEIYHILMRYSKSWDFLSAKELREFLSIDQGMTHVSVKDCEEIIQEFEPAEERKEKRELSVDGFTHFLLSRKLRILNPSHREMYQDMNQPLSHYYIASSHNTYLTGDQLKSSSSVEMYVRALKMGCRCVELDCWDGDDEPEIYHGRTLTSHILFRDVIEAINESAFATSDYPVILSLENHCSIPMQQKMAHYMKEILGEKLYSALPDPSILPSPESLRGKFLIKGKKLAPEVADDAEVSSDEDEEEQGSDGDETDGKKKKKKAKLAKELSDLVSYVQSVHFESFSISSKFGKTYQMSSFSENKMLSLSSSSSSEFIDYNKRQLSRIYPAGNRFTSSNYNPQTAWNVGCQIVALNYQTDGEEMDLNNGRFQINGACGYVLKPEILRTPFSYVVFDQGDVIPGVLPMLMKIKVISGQRLPKPPDSGAKGEVIDPFVVIDVHGIGEDNYRGKTKACTNNGFNPVWSETFQYFLKFPDVAILRFSVLDDDFVGDDFIGQFCLPVSSIQTGYRHVPLLSKKGDPLPGATIFVHVEFETAVSQEECLFDMNAFAKSVSKFKMRPIGIPDMDAVFQTFPETLKKSSLVKINFHVAIEEFKKSCGFTSSATLYEAVKACTIQAHRSGIKMEELLTEENEKLVVVSSVKSRANHDFQQVLSKLEKMLSCCQDVLSKTDAFVEKMMEIYQAGEKINLPEKLRDLQEKSAVKAKADFLSNLQTVKGYAHLSRLSKDEAAWNLRTLTA
ncbi:1-phosphatidylinositol 4,5-bisphosphate phosphodiesterase zeta-1-like isoform X2 [Oscarella lobularis]|uniref:1-phosphatidylinositol 4,5-bisphosphate phosphodiesterase zeta-1-like isoform X2 n=1 Tax=Oscarella lobularis TaxID=121494 RepID=UPI0033143726